MGLVLFMRCVLGGWQVTVSDVCSRRWNISRPVYLSVCIMKYILRTVW